MYAVYRVILDEVEYFPKVVDIEDVLRYRGDKRLKDFREVLVEWSEVFRSGNLKAEDKIRKDIRKANNELKFMGKIQKTGKYVTYLSLPAMLFPPLSAAMTVVSNVIQFTSDKLLKRNKWLMIGK